MRGMCAFGHTWTEAAVVSLSMASSYIILSYLWYMAIESLSVLRMQYACIRNFTFLSGETCEQNVFDFSQPAEVARWLRLRALMQVWYTYEYTYTCAHACTCTHTRTHTHTHAHTHTRARACTHACTIMVTLIALIDGVQ